MLVYIRDCDREVIMRDLAQEEVPRHLKERFDEENSFNHKLEKDQSLVSECGNAYIITPETISDWRDQGIC